MHSSRMRTARLLTVFRSIPCISGVLPPGGFAYGGSASRVGSAYGGGGWADPLPVDKMTDACENITLPQTSFAGGN